MLYLLWGLLQGIEAAVSDPEFRSLLETIVAICVAIAVLVLVARSRKSN